MRKWCVHTNSHRALNIMTPDMSHGTLRHV